MENCKWSWCLCQQDLAMMMQLHYGNASVLELHSGSRQSDRRSVDSMPSPQTQSVPAELSLNYFTPAGRHSVAGHSSTWCLQNIHHFIGVRFSCLKNAHIMVMVNSIFLMGIFNECPLLSTFVKSQEGTGSTLKI